jgi:hypothetical protein
MVGRTVTNDLSPQRFHNRLPFFAKVHEYDPATNSTVSGTPTFVLRCLSAHSQHANNPTPLECSSARVHMQYCSTLPLVGGLCAVQCMQHHARSAKRLGCIPPKPNPASDIERDTVEVLDRHGRLDVTRLIAQVTLQGNTSEVMAAEINYAFEFGIDFWAFCWYPAGCVDYDPPASACPMIQCCADSWFLNYALEVRVVRAMLACLESTLARSWAQPCCFQAFACVNAAPCFVSMLLPCLHSWRECYATLAT